MGRYFLYRLHPLSVAELSNPAIREAEISSKSYAISDDDFNALFEYGGFPEPFLRRNKKFYQKWKRLRMEQLLEEDIRDLTRIQEHGEIELLAELLAEQVGQQTNYSALASKVQVSIDTIRRWMKVLKSFYYCFTLQP